MSRTDGLLLRPDRFPKPVRSIPQSNTHTNLRNLCHSSVQRSASAITPWHQPKWSSTHVPHSSPRPVRVIRTSNMSSSLPAINNRLLPPRNYRHWLHPVRYAQICTFRYNSPRLYPPPARFAPHTLQKPSIPLQFTTPPLRHPPTTAYPIFHYSLRITHYTFHPVHSVTIHRRPPTSPSTNNLQPHSVYSPCLRSTVFHTELAIRGLCSRNIGCTLLDRTRCRSAAPPTFSNTVCNGSRYCLAQRVPPGPAV